MGSQEELRRLLRQRGWDVTQSTLSRDLRELLVAFDRYRAYVEPGSTRWVPRGAQWRSMNWERDRKGQYGVRINDQWRICFVWTDSGPTQVEIVNYH